MIEKAEEMKTSIDQHSLEGEHLTTTLTNPSKIEDVKGENDSMLAQYNLLLESLRNTLLRYLYMFYRGDTNGFTTKEVI